MLLDEQSLKISRFEPVLASVIGDSADRPGGLLIAEAILGNRSRVEPRDWLYCLARAPGTWIRKRLVDLGGKAPEVFIEAIDGGLPETADSEDLPQAQLTSANVSDGVVKMLEHAEALLKKSSKPKVTDAVLTLALIETATDDLREMLVSWAGEDGMKKLTDLIHAEVTQPAVMPPVFKEDGKLDTLLFGPSGRAFCKRAVEDAAALGAKKITTRHLLYTLLNNPRGLLPVALASRGISVKSEVQAPLSRELAKPGRKRNDALTLSRESIFPTVEKLFEESLRAAFAVGDDTIGEADVGRAFVLKYLQELTRFFSAAKALDLASLREFVRTFDPEDDAEATAPIQQYTLQEIENKVQKHVIGQEKAIAQVIPWIKRLRFGLPRDGRPAAVFLFLGPTGTGKTQLAKELARFVFGDPEMMLFLEMGQFQSKESMSMFIGAPPGYVGYGEGKLTNGLGEKPECVVLFDEIEKAHIEVFDTLLRFADEGVISDPAGPQRDGRKCIIVMTTNAGQKWLREHLGGQPPETHEDPEKLAADLLAAAKKEMEEKKFRPEFLGRVDACISFLPFTLKTCRQIVDGILAKEIEKFENLKNVFIQVPDDVRDLLAKKAHERSLDEGARGAPRAVNNEIITRAIDILTAEGMPKGSSKPIYLVATANGPEVQIARKML